MHRSFAKQTIALLVLLVYCFTTQTAFAEPAADLSTELEATPLYELEELRTETSKTFLLSDGSFQYVGYADTVHYSAPNGELREIHTQIADCTLRAGDTSLQEALEPAEIGSTEDASAQIYRYTNAENAWHVYFKNYLTDPQAILLQKDNAALSLQLCTEPTGEEEGETASDASMRPPIAARKAVDLSVDSPSYQIVGGDERAILYADAVRNVDISYTVLNGAVKENLILKSANHGTITFRITGYGVEYFEENGHILFRTDKEEPMFELGTLFAEDANGKHTEAVSHSIEREGDSLLYTVTLDEAFLAAEDTVFPVAIDPSIMITGSSNTYDTCVDEEYPSSNYYLAESLWTGGENGKNSMRTFIKFNLPNNITASNITNAYIHIKKREHRTPTVRAYRVTENWTSRTITWNSKPKDTPNSPSPVITLDSGAWYKITVTTMVKDWIKGTYPNYGFCLKEPMELDRSQKTKYYSSDAPSPNKPELIITYTGSSGETTPYYGSREYQYVNNTHVNCMGYALEYKQYITPEIIGLNRTVMTGMTKNEAVEYIASLAETWMGSHFRTGSFKRIASYNSPIDTGWYRVALRFGFVDGEDKDGRYEDGDSYDYHWWYQTKEDDGIWAEKPGVYMSRKTSCNGTTNPAASVWTSGTVPYDSKIIYFAIRDDRDIVW